MSRSKSLKVTIVPPDADGARRLTLLLSGVVALRMAGNLLIEATIPVPRRRKHLALLRFGGKIENGSEIGARFRVGRVGTAERGADQISIKMTHLLALDLVAGVVADVQTRNAEPVEVTLNVSGLPKYLAKV